MKYIFVTGGVVSSLGKGLAAASIGTLLERCGLKVTLQKFDPYLNVDPGTMSPFQHGEVYVLNDGAETDLDLGHYERFVHCNLSRLNNLTSGQVFESVLHKERRGDYLGKTVQYIPHVTDEIKNRLYEVTEQSDVDIIITEIGGTVGDMEGHIFLEALRQFALEVGRDNVCFIHVTLLPYIKAAGEMKTKPTQQSVAKLREIGIQPDVIICRTEYDMSEDERRKIAMFCNVEAKNVIAFRDVKNTIYECPLDLSQDKIDRIVTRRLGLDVPAPNLADWQRYVGRVISPSHSIRIAVVGKYIALQDAYKSIYESFTHAGAENDARVEILRIDAEEIEEKGAEAMIGSVDGILVPGGFGDRGIEGKIQTVEYARTKGIPFLGICLGMQVAVIDSANGHISFNTPSLFQGIPFDNIRLTLKNGLVVHAEAGDKTGELNAILDTDPGARRLGEFAFGVNPAITRPMRNILFDEKISGSFHLTPGQAYHVADNGNQSRIHWDMVCIQTEAAGGGDIYLDGKLVRRNGLFTLPELAILTPSLS